MESRDNDNEARSIADELSAKNGNTQREALSQAERIAELRERLYARGAKSEMTVRHSLKDDTPRPTLDLPRMETVRSFLPESMRPRPQGESVRKAVPPPTSREPEESPATNITPMSERKPKRPYRLKLLAAAATFFVGAVATSSYFLLSGNNLISGENISLSVQAPFTVGGGEEIELQIAVANQNVVPIESATLIIDYPRGTQAVDSDGKELFTVRQELSKIDSGEVITVPMRARVYGEENEEKIIKVSVEYRVAGSNATFFKDAEPHRFKISTSPVVLSVNTVKSITSGQEAEIELTVQSNSPTTLKDLLVKAVYPEVGFDFSSSEPDPSAGEDTWLVKELAPGSKKILTLKGVVVGKQDEERTFAFSVGVPNEKNTYEMLSTYFTAKQIISLEQPFLDLTMTTNNDDRATVIVDDDNRATISVVLENTLDDTLYTAQGQVLISGPGVSGLKVDPGEGFYDSNKHSISWDQSSMETLDEVPPGEKRELSFAIDVGNSKERISELLLEVIVRAERVFEDRVPQELIGTISQKIRVEGSSKLSTFAIYSDGPFANRGPIPPVANEETTYTFLLVVDNGSNEVTKAEVSAVLPQYVTWLGNVSEGDVVTFNPTSRTMTWNIGDMGVGAHKEAWIQVSFTPSTSQIKTRPTLLNTQRFKANDKFTNTTIRDEAPALTTALLNDPSESARSGEVTEQ